MDTNKNKRNILDLMDDLELELLQKDTEYAKHYLREEGLDIVEEQNFASQYMKKIQFMAKALTNKKQDKTLLERALERVKKGVVENATKTSEVLMSLLQTKTPSIQYRKIENWTDDEIRDVLTDVDLVHLIEELGED